MNKISTVFGIFRVSFLFKQQSVHHVCNNKHCRLLLLPAYNLVSVRDMAQKSITSFFKIAPKNCADDYQEKTAKRSFKRHRSDSEEHASPTASQHSPSSFSSDKKKKTKRQRLESSESETESPKKSPVPSETDTKHQAIGKVENKKPTTYQSPKMKKKQRIKEEPISPPDGGTVPNTDSYIKNTNEVLFTDGQLKEELPSSNGDKGVLSNSNTKSPSSVKVGEKGKSPVTKSPFEIKNKKTCTIDNDIQNETAGVTNVGGAVAEMDYKPAKHKYEPVADACWREGQAVPYLALARTLEAIEGTSARLKMVEILSNYIRSVIALTPEDLLPSIYLCLNQLGPAYHSIELGIAETYLMKAVGQCTGRTLGQMKAAAQRAGDLGLVAEQARATQRTMFAPPPLTVRKVFHALKEVALMTGQASVNKKIGKIQSLYVACRQSEARYLIRSLEGKLRVGLAEQSLLQALALALASDAPGEPRGPDALKARLDKFALIIKTTYCECPNYELILPVLLQHGVEALPQHCRLTPGIPLKPMLAHPVKGVYEVFNRFDSEEFTCEFKYDGERAQIHVPATEDGSAPALGRAALFSRNQENNTSKYPDILSRLPALLGDAVTSCVLDCEAVAYDPATKQILPFQVLSTRKRKDATEATVSVQVCVFVFDLLYLNGRALVREPLAERRRLLREHLRETEGTWQFAKSRDCTSTEEVQQFLEEAVRGSCEGLMVKTLRGENARYDIARRSRNWLKLKKDYLDGVGDTIDVVVIGGYWGRGKRSGAFGGFLLACYDPAAEEYQSLCKIGTGFSDDDLKTLSETLQRHVIDSPPNYYRYDSGHAPDAWFAAACVWEVRCADLSLSPVHRAAAGLAHRDKGVSLRFPRFLRVREDKAPEQATSAQQIAEMYFAQDQVRNQAAKPPLEDDFY